jgi:hypothetical protein
MAPPGLPDYNGFATDENTFSAGVTLVGLTADAVTVRLQLPVGCQNCASGRQAACSYSLSRPPRTGRRWIRSAVRSAIG